MSVLMGLALLAAVFAASATRADGPVPEGIIGAGFEHTCALLPSGAVDCWGYNDFGQADDQPGPYTQVSAGMSHTCALTPSGAAHCWGLNDAGQADGQPGPYTQVFVGSYHNCALTPSAAADCWGTSYLADEAEDQLGPYVQLSVAAFHNCALAPSGAVDCWGWNPYGESDDQPGPYTQVSAGQHHNCALTPAGAADCWGQGWWGEEEDQPGPYTQVSAGQWHTCALTPSGAVDCWGYNEYGQADDQPGPYTLVVAGWTHTCALTPSGAVDCWGDNFCGKADDQPGPYGPYNPNPNTAPVANPAGPYLGAINTAISFDGSGSSDPDGDPLAYAWTFGDGGTATEAMPAHSYAAAGIYDVCLAVHDGTLDSDPACTLAVVYDPSAGFVTGGGWINSPAGAYKLDPNLSGKATFGFISKYKKGAQVPTGTTQFQFDVASFSFYSETYEWLVVNQGGTNAQFKGSGTVNGGLDPNGNVFTFMIWAGDGATTGGSDTFRIRIWWEDTAGEHDVYDNGAVQPIGGGNIVVHTSK